MSDHEFPQDQPSPLTIDLQPTSSRSWILRPVPFATQLRSAGHTIGRALTDQALKDVMSVSEVRLSNLCTTPIARCAQDAQLWGNDPDERVVLGLARRMGLRFAVDGIVSWDDLDTLEAAIVTRAIGDAERQGLLWTSLLDACTALLTESPLLESYCRAAEPVLRRWVAEQPTNADVREIVVFGTPWVRRAILDGATIDADLIAAVLRFQKDPLEYLRGQRVRDPAARRLVRNWIYKTLVNGDPGLQMAGESVRGWFAQHPLSIRRAEPLIAMLERVRIARAGAKHPDYDAQSFAWIVWKVLAGGAVLDTSGAERVFVIGRWLDNLPMHRPGADQLAPYRLLSSPHVPENWVARTALRECGDEARWALISASRHPRARRNARLRDRLNSCDYPDVHCNLLIGATEDEWVVQVRWLLANAPARALTPIQDSIGRAARLLHRQELTPLCALEGLDDRLRAFAILADWPEVA